MLMCACVTLFILMLERLTINPSWTLTHTTPNTNSGQYKSDEDKCCEKTGDDFDAHSSEPSGQRGPPGVVIVTTGAGEDSRRENIASSKRASALHASQSTPRS